VRGALARHTLASLLGWAFFDADLIANLPEEEIHLFLYHVGESVTVLEPAWAPTIGDPRATPVGDWRRAMVEAFADIRALAKDVATGKSTARVTIAVEISASPDDDREGRPLWGLHVGTAQALLWFALNLFHEVPRSLIRTCGIGGGCDRVYVAIKNQTYCLRHRAEARRLAQREAERKFRDRQRAKKRKRRRK
jgi:hypothetical protein